MNSKTHLKVTGTLLILTPIIFMTAFTLLQINFEYPDILRQPATIVMEKFVAGGSGLIANWYLMVISSILFIPISVMLHPYLARDDTPYMPLATTFGVIAGVVQMLGFIRWTFLVPTLASTYLNPSTCEATRAAIEVTFVAFNQYAGVGIGEHLGYIFTALWTILIALAMPKSKYFSSWLGWTGVVIALGILLGTLEPAGVPYVGLVNAIAYSLWAVWIVILGVRLLAQKGG
ncbi:MAG: DUF4386 domain-containing protein [Chloroflexi bacterium]|nr:DUF4386 domain-containing protein [Chloroflexota bacterium]